VATVNISALLVVLLAACAAQTQTVRVVSVNLASAATPKSVQFFCTDDYERKACLKDVIHLQTALAPFPLEQLGEWHFLIVPSDRWKTLVGSMGGNPASPAFTVLERRTIVFEQTLFSPRVPRQVELLLMFNLAGEALLRLAVSHELGHALCGETNEGRADRYGKELRAGRVPSCRLQKPNRRTGETIGLLP